MHSLKQILPPYNTTFSSDQEKSLKQCGRASGRKTEFASPLGLPYHHHREGLQSLTIFSKNFWRYVKPVFQTSSTLLPSFSEEQCSQYFFQMSSHLSPMQKDFYIFMDSISRRSLIALFLSKDHIRNSSYEIFCHSMSPSQNFHHCF